MRKMSNNEHNTTVTLAPNIKEKKSSHKIA